MEAHEKVLQSRIIRQGLVDWKACKWLQPKNLKEQSEDQKNKLRASMVRNGFASPFFVWEKPNGECVFLDGHHRDSILRELEADGYEVPQQLPAAFVECKDTKDANKFVLVFSSSYAKTQRDGFLEFIDGLDKELILSEVNIPELDLGPFMDGSGPDLSGALVGKFGAPPFTVFDSRQGYWQDRKREWMAIGIESHLGRGENLLKFSKSVQLHRSKNGMPNADARMPGVADQYKNGTSIFDPVLCEIMYRWFCPKGGSVLDPFAGGSVRGIVCGKLGYSYTGIELRDEQVRENERQVSALGLASSVQYILGDSRDVMPSAGAFDFVFSCPPYGNLEVYSDDPRDISTMPHSQFLEAYNDVVGRAVALLAENRFAAFVVGDFRDEAGFYRRFVSDTITAFESAGARLYNEAVLVTAVGSLPLRIAKQFGGYRKLGKSHQNVLVFYKGDPKAIRATFGNVPLKEIL